MKDDAFEKLFKTYYNEALLYICSFTHDKSQAEDIVAEGFFRAFKSIDDEHEGFKYWLFKVCRNLYFDAYRKQKQLSPMSDEFASCEEELADKVIQDEQYRALYKAISLLKDNYREALKLYYFSGLSVKDIAGVMNMSTENVKITLFRARNKLKCILEDKI